MNDIFIFKNVIDQPIKVNIDGTLFRITKNYCDLTGYNKFTTVFRSLKGNAGTYRAKWASRALPIDGGHTND